MAFYMSYPARCIRSFTCACTEAFEQIGHGAANLERLSRPHTYFKQATHRRGITHKIGTPHNRGTKYKRGATHRRGTIRRRGTTHEIGTPHKKGATHKRGTTHKKGATHNEGTVVSSLSSVPVMSLVASMMKMREISREKISSVNRVKNSTIFDRENKLRPPHGRSSGKKKWERVFNKREAFAFLWRINTTLTKNLQGRQRRPFIYQYS